MNLSPYVRKNWKLSFDRSIGIIKPKSKIFLSIYRKDKKRFLNHLIPKNISEVQKKYDLKSFASQFGILNTFIFSVFLDFLSMCFFILFGYINDLNIIYLFGCIAGSMVHIIKYLRNWPKSDKINLRPEFFRWNTLFSLLISGFGIISII